MNSSFSTLADSFLEMLSAILDTLDQLHTVSIEFTVLREKSLPIGVEFTCQCLLAEQKPHVRIVHLKNDVKKPKKDVGHIY